MGERGKMISPQAKEKADREHMVFEIDMNHSEGTGFVATKRLSDGNDYWLGHKVKNLHDPKEQMDFLEEAVLAFEKTERLRVKK